STRTCGFKTRVSSLGGTASCQSLHSDIRRRFIPRSLSHKIGCHFESSRIMLHGISFLRNTENYLCHDKGLYSVMASKTNSNIGPTSTSPSNTVEQLYACINDKNLKQLGEYIAVDANFKDRSFPRPFEGKKEVMQFFEQLTESMGKNVKFSIGNICQGDELTAAVNWHLEWKGTEIPFSRGCSFFKCSKEGEKVKIKRAEVLIESPVKPGGLSLTLLKTLTSFFDDFPKAAEWFLRSPHAVLHRLKFIYNILIAPFVNPLLDGYIKLWSFLARLLGYAFNILVYISKIFFK
ncbi:Nuclear transport factor 2 (NTF2) family protein, partial [Quillaja saponaria]